MDLLIVFVGAGAGGTLRYALGTWIQELSGSSFPWGTLTINITGSLFLGFLYALLEGTAAIPEWRLLLGVGLCGGYTTFSAFSYESLRLLQDGEFGRGAAYILASVLLALTATLLGFRGAASLLGRR